MQRAGLEAELAAARQQRADLEASFQDVVAAAVDSNLDDEHDPEGATIAAERQQVDALARAAQRRIVDVEAALARLDTGTYGTCIRCGQLIADARLEARPAAALCIECARAR